MSLRNFNLENLKVCYISLNLKGLAGTSAIASPLFKYFTPHILINDVPSIGFHGLRNK